MGKRYGEDLTIEVGNKVVSIDRSLETRQYVKFNRNGQRSRFYNKRAKCNS